MWRDTYSHWDKTVWKETMIQTIIINPKLKEHPTLNNTTIIDALDTPRTTQQINKLSEGPLHIYDITHNPKHKTNETIKVLDHINKTGHNPLIGHQNQLTKPFIDISNLYNTTNGVITHCLGKHFNQHKKDYEYPSTYLCYVSIIAKAVGKNDINAFLINLL